MGSLHKHYLGIEVDTFNMNANQGLITNLILNSKLRQDCDTDSGAHGLFNAFVIANSHGDWYLWEAPFFKNALHHTCVLIAFEPEVKQIP